MTVSDAAGSGGALLEVRDLTVSFGRRPPAVRDVSFDLARGQRLGLIGESGSGKSVTALAVMGLLAENARVHGSVRLEGRELLGLSDRQMSSVRGNEIGMIFQEPMTALDPTMIVGRQVAEVLRLHEGAAPGPLAIAWSGCWSGWASTIRRGSRRASRTSCREGSGSG